MIINFKFPTFLCVNCDKPIAWSRRKKIFCSDICKEEAKYVRYYRQCQSDGRIFLPDIQEALQIRKAMLFSGGYPSNERFLSKEIRSLIIERDKGICQICGKNGSDIDHIHGSSSELPNLQLLCRECHLKKTKQNLVPVDLIDPDNKKIMEKEMELEIRTHVEEAVRECDDQNRWEKRYKEIENKRKREYHLMLRELLMNMGKGRWTSREMANYLNELNISTFSGHGKWESKLILAVIKTKLFDDNAK